MIDRYTNKIDESKMKLQRAIHGDPDNEDLKKELKHLMTMEATKNKGNNFFNQRKFDESIKFYDEAFVLDPYNSMWKAVILSNKASCYMASKETAKALDMMKQSTIFDPNNPKNMYKKGKLEKEMKEWDSALKSMQTAKSMDGSLTIDADIKQIYEELKKINDKNYYEIMGIPKTATQEEIKKTYKELARKFHPDRHHGDETERAKAEKIFKDINEANQILSDPKKRKQYDDSGCKKGSEHEHSGFSGFNGMDPNDLFSMFFSNGNGFKFGSNTGGGAARGSKPQQQAYSFRFG